jgi:tyrosyl-tRNA synthetase
MSSLWERLRARAVEIHVAEHLRMRLEREDRLRVKFGMDPTAPDLHLGHLVVLDVLKDFQDQGHTVVLVVGDYTARIGDPSGRSETRPMLTREQVQQNARTYFDQIYQVLDREKTEVHGNAEWLGEMAAADILRLLGTQTLQSVLQREDFATRLAKGIPIGAHELLYPFSQAYDSVAVRADVEVGGTDQLFNLLFGREVQRAYGQEPQDIAVFPLLEGVEGVQKMSKSLDNYIGIAEDPAQIYGKTMSIPDHLTARWLELVSGWGPDQVAAVLALGPRDAKAALASRLVERLHGEAAARAAEEDFAAKFRRRDVPPEDLPEHEPAAPRDLIGTLVELGWYPSRSHAKRVVEQGGAGVNGQKVGLDHQLKNGDVLKAGKKNFVRIRVR